MSAAIPNRRCAEFARTVRISWTSVSRRHPRAIARVSNVYGDVGQLFATTLVAEAEWSARR